MPKSWFTIKAQAADADVAEVSILDYIGMWGINAPEFLKEFRAIKAEKVKVFINSPGGSVFEALAIFNGMRATGKNLEVHVLGVAASAASYIAMAGHKVVMPANTMMFVHNPINAVYGNAEEMRAMADTLDKIGASLMATYRKRFTGNEEALQQLFADESYLTAAECLEYGLCDEVTDEIKAEAAFDVDLLPEAVRQVFEAAKGEPEPPLVETPLVEPQVVAAVAHVASDVIEQIAAATKVPDLAMALALRPGLTTQEAVQAAADNAREVHALCRITGVEATRADALARSFTSLADVRATLAAEMAAADDAAHVDTARKSASTGPAAQTAVINPLSLWDEIHANEKQLRSAA